MFDEPYVIEYHRCSQAWEIIPTPGDLAAPLGRCTFVHLDGVRCGTSAHLQPGMVTAFAPRMMTRAAIDAHRKAQDDARA